MLRASTPAPDWSMTLRSAGRVSPHRHTPLFRTLLKPGSRWLLVAGFLGLLLSLTPLAQHLEWDLYDFQLKLSRRLKGDPVPTPELVMVALDNTSEQAGFSEEDLVVAADHLPGVTNLIPGQDLTRMFQADADGTLRAVRLYQRTDRGIEWSPLFLSFLRQRRIDPEDVVVTSTSIQAGKLTFRTDREGRIYPLFPYPNLNSGAFIRELSSSSLTRRVLELVYRSPKAEFAGLAPVSLVHLPEIVDELEDRLTVLGTHVQSADNLELPTPTGRMVALEFYASTLDSLLAGRSLAPLSTIWSVLLALLAIGALSAALPGRGGIASVGVSSLAALLWVGLCQLMFLVHLIPWQSPVLLSFTAILGGHLFLRSHRLAQLLYGFGGHEVLLDESSEIEATICFTNLPAQITEAENSDLEKATALRKAYAECLGHVVERHGGRLVDQQGDAQMLAFGLGGESNHALRAVACALDITEGVARLLEGRPHDPQHPLSHCGVVTGLVARGQVGAGDYRSVAAIGDTTNTAARLMGRASKDGKAVLASTRTVELIGPRLAATPYGEISVKGKSEAVPVEEILSLSEPPKPILTAPSLKPPRASRALLAASLLLGTLFTLWLNQKLPFHIDLLDTVAVGDKKAPLVWAGLDAETMRVAPWPWPRSHHAQVIKNCEAAGVKALFFDVLFDQPSTPEEDRALVESVQRSSITIVAAASRPNALDLALPPELIPGLIESGNWAVINESRSRDDEDNLFRAVAWNWKIVDDEFPWEGPAVSKIVAERLKPERLKTMQNRDSFLVRWGPPPERISYYRLLDPQDPIFAQLSGTVVVVADALPEPSDEFETPHGRMKGGLIHCFSLQTMLTGDFLWPAPTAVQAFLVLVVLGGTVLTSLRFPDWGHQILLLLGGSSLSLALCLKWAHWNSIYLGAGMVLAVPVGIVIAGILRLLDVSQALTSYVPPHLQREVEENGYSVGRSVTATVLLTDIRGYTTLSEGRSPSEILSLLNRYHEVTADCYRTYGGHLLTYQGDAQIVVFGPLEHVANPVEQALKAAGELGDLVEKVAAEAGLEPGVLRVGAGITTGPVNLSLIKAGDQLQYTVVGQPVRRAHKLQSLSDKVGSDIILDSESYAMVCDSVACWATFEDGMEAYIPQRTQGS